MATFTGAANVNDTLIGGTGNDSFFPFTSLNITPGDIVNGGSGRDTLFLDYSAQATGIGITSIVNVNAATGGFDGSFATDLFKVTYTSIEIFNIKGTQFNDVLKGGSLADVLMGGAGDDTIDGFQGTDTIDGGDGNDILRGGDGNDTITGGKGKDVLNGGAGTDIMTGGLDNDVYFVDRNTDQVIENAGEGIDKVFSSANIFSLYANVENLTLSEGSNAVTGTGNASNNRIEGNSNNNILSGGLGNDNLSGGAGNDQLLGGDGLDFLFGDAGDDLLIGGSGADRLTGGMGKDRFRFENVDGFVDIITDFSVTDDLIEISKSGFGLSLPLGTLSAGSFVLGSTAVDANDFFLYDTATGKLAFDSNGSGTGSRSVIAQLSTGLSLSNTNFKIIA